jgi:hypothetical protein
MSKPEDELEAKLNELELSLQQAESAQVAKPNGSTEVAKTDKEEVKSDLNLVIGLGLILTGIFLIFNHVKVGMSFFSWFGFGQQGFGLIFVPLLIGICLIFYNYNWRAGWILTAASCALIFFAILSQLIMSFPTTSILGLIIMFLPLVAGIALTLKGLTGRKQ